jgi:hypothetical protein
MKPDVRTPGLSAFRHGEFVLVRGQMAQPVHSRR